MAAALVATLFVIGPTASADPPKKHAYCHGTGSDKNLYVIIVVDAGRPKDRNHQKHLIPDFSPGTIRDIDLGLTGLKTKELKEQCGDEEVQCVTTPTTPPTTATTATTPTSATTPASPGGGTKGNLPNTGGLSGSALLLSVGVTLLAVAGTLIVARKRIFG